MTKTGMTLGLTVLATAALAGCGGDEPPAKTAPSGAGGPPATAAPAPRNDASAAVMPINRNFHYWRVICDNGNRCAAFAGSDEGAWIMIRRDAGPGAAPVITAGHGPAYGDEGPPEAELTFDGQGQPLRQIADVGLSVPPGDVMRTLSRLAAAKEVRLSVMDEGPEIPAAGAAAAMLLIDERQGRLGTVDAMVRRGDRPAASVAAPPALPQVVPAPAVDQGELAAGNSPLTGDADAPPAPTLPAAVEALPVVKSCRQETGDNTIVQEAVMAARLGPRTELWGVPCSIGAYNASYALFVTGPGGSDPRPAVFPTWRGLPLTEGEQDWLTNPSYNPRTRVLNHFPRGRGIGDCGVIQSWTWTGQGFVQKEEKAMDDCLGMGSRRWPTTWRTR